MSKWFVWLTIVGLVMAVGLRSRGRADTQVMSLGHGGRERSYRLHLPQGSAPPETGWPLVLVLHGGGGNARQMEKFSRFSRLADEQRFVVAYPEGVDRGWNDGRVGEFNTAHRDNVDDLGFLKAVVEDIAAQHRLDRRRIYATGISNGGFMSARLGADASEVFSAIAPVVAGLPRGWGERLQPALPVSVMVVQGTADPLVPYLGGWVQVFERRRGEILATEDSVLRWREANGCQAPEVVEALEDRDLEDGCRATRYRYEGGRGQSAVELWKIEGGGHTWPGSIQYLPKKMVGPVCRDFDATEAIWRFFQTHPRLTN